MSWMKIQALWSCGLHWTRFQHIQIRSARAPTQAREGRTARHSGKETSQTWWTSVYAKMIMSFDLPDFKDSTIMIFFQANSQLPAFGRYTLEYSEQFRPHRVLDNPMGHEGLWVAQTASPSDVCFRDGEYKFDIADKHVECALCPGARASELLPCCFCTNWVHLRCSFAVPCGRACASHFDVQRPMEKQIVASKDDPLVPDEYKEKPVFPNISIPRYLSAKANWSEGCHEQRRTPVDIQTCMA